MLAGLRWLSKRGGAGTGLAAATLGNLFAGLAALPMALPVSHVTTTDIGVLCYLGFVQVGLAYVLLTHGIRRVPAVEATTLLMAEPALSPLWSWLVHRERPAGWSLAGGAVILGATLVNTWRRRRA
jgi:drug/metabolite transporter (DMT)-like permease